ncbi:MAG: phage major capsid protein [Methylocystis sp.]|uniref:phage major capsid protein n=1 Tax=Methylocystis sp. TaxID=1911079 RepID=UPI003DA2F077
MTKHSSPSTMRVQGSVMTRLASVQPGDLAARTDKTISFVFANPGAVRGDNHQIMKGAWVSNWKGQTRDGLTSFRRNPVVIEGHDPTGRAVGKVTSIMELPDGRLTGTILFADTEDGAELYELYRSGAMSACSIGWMVVDAKRSTDPARGLGALDIQKAELMEVSLVPVGADENALVLGRAVKRSDRSRAYAEARNSATFSSFGEQMQAIWKARASGEHDARLVRAPAGAGEIDGSNAGYLVDTAFLPTLVESLFKESVILPLCDVRETSGPLADVKIPAIDETSRADGSRYGGALAAWVSEGSAPAASTPRFRQLSFSAKKCVALCYVSNELFNDSPMLESSLRAAFSAEMAFAVEKAIFSGTGPGQPLGILNSSAKITVAKESGQAAKTIVYENVLNMYQRMVAGSRHRAVWLINTDIEKQLFAMSQAIGASSIPVYLPASGGASLYPTLFGRPVIPVEYASTLGTEGDVTFVDFSSYICVHQGMKLSLSADVQFVSDQSVFRFVYRLDGQNGFYTPVLPFQGTETKSNIVTLATRA